MNGLRSDSHDAAPPPGSAGGLRPRSAGPGGLEEERLRRVLLHVETHLQGALRLEELASVAGTSRAHFARQFRRSTGHSPHQYVLRCRIELARQLLRHTDLPIGEIALRAGFVDQSHLNRRFRAELGLTPGLFAQQARGRGARFHSLKDAP
jgi:AraC family transcriptional regulator